MDAPQLTLDQLVYGRERWLFGAMVLVGVLIYAVIGVIVYTDPSTGGVIIFFGVLFALAGFFRARARAGPHPSQRGARLGDPVPAAQSARRQPRPAHATPHYPRGV